MPIQHSWVGQEPCAPDSLVAHGCGPATCSINCQVDRPPDLLLLFIAVPKGVLTIKERRVFVYDVDKKMVVEEWVETP
jgi:hypothetical protein